MIGLEWKLGEGERKKDKLGELENTKRKKKVNEEKIKKGVDNKLKILQSKKCKWI